MPLHRDNSKNNLRIGLDKSTKIHGLDAFRKNLEKDFFSEAHISNQSSDDTEANLVIEIYSNFGLLETLAHFNEGIWGNVQKRNTNEHGISSFLKSLCHLKKQNSLHLDIEEFSIFLNDTTIIINKIYEQSIPDQLENIITEIAKHQVYCTKGFSEIPFEIYVPVFEENFLENDIALSNIRTRNHNKKDYFRYWGLYFGSEEDAVIYDLASKCNVSGDLYMLSH